MARHEGCMVCKLCLSSVLLKRSVAHHIGEPPNRPTGLIERTRLHSPFSTPYTKNQNPSGVEWRFRSPGPNLTQKEKGTLIYHFFFDIPRTNLPNPLPALLPTRKIRIKGSKLTRADHDLCLSTQSVCLRSFLNGDTGEVNLQETNFGFSEQRSRDIESRAWLCVVRLESSGEPRVPY